MVDPVDVPDQEGQEVGDALPVSERDQVGVGVRLGVRLWLPVRLPVPDGDGVHVRLLDPVGEGLNVLVTEEDGVPVPGLRVLIRLREWLLLGERDRDPRDRDHVRVGTAVIVSVPVWLHVRLKVDTLLLNDMDWLGLCDDDAVVIDVDRELVWL